MGRIKAWVEEYKKDIFIAGVIFLSSMASFGLGRLSVAWQAHPPIVITDPSGKPVDNPNAILNRSAIGQTPAGKQRTVSTVSAAEAQLVASKNGTAYHLLTCPGALQIKDENKVYFKTRAEAEAAGYKPAGNCPGLKK